MPMLLANYMGLTCDVPDMIGLVWDANYLLKNYLTGLFSFKYRIYSRTSRPPTITRYKFLLDLNLEIIHTTNPSTSFF